MFKHLNTTLIALGCVLALTGCITKDYPPCEPLKVNLVVADKNYSNVAEVDEEETLDESLPFRAYVPTMFYVLRNAETGEVIETSGLEMTTNEASDQTITFPEDLPHGKYDMIVWGGIKSLNALEFDHNPSTAAFHTTQDSDEDIYLGHAVIDYQPLEATAELVMKRTMGKLIIVKELVGRAEGVSRSQKTLTDVRHYIDLESNYNGSNDVVFENSFPYQPEVITKTIVAPTASESKTKVHMEFYNDTPNTPFPILIPEDVKINIRPNEITVLRYVYDPKIEEFDIYIRNNNNGWDKVHQLDLED